MENNKISELDILTIEFSDSKVPQFKEVRNKDYILYGEDNQYPYYLLYLYNKSSSHNAIINGKTKYICGSGIDRLNNSPGGFNDYVEDVNGIKVKHKAMPVNRDGETMFTILKKSQKDIEIFGGFRWSIIKNRLGVPVEIYHVDFDKFRKAKCSSGFYYKESWLKENREDAVYYESFDPNVYTNKPTIFAHDEYRPGSKWYPMPGYIGANNYIEVDIEISKFHLSSIKNGMSPSKMIQFYTGEPEETKKKAIENKFKQKFGGSENAGKFILVFNNSKEKTVDIDDLSGSDLDKQFDILNTTTEQHIITGHEVVSPLLFGIKTEGQLGNNNELRTAYEMFINTYAKTKQDHLEEIINYFGGLMGRGEDYFIKQLDPVGVVVSDEMIAQVLQPGEIRELAGLPKIEQHQNSKGAQILAALSAVSPLVANKILEALSEDEIRSFVDLAPKTQQPLDVNGNPLPPTIPTVQQQQQERSQSLNIPMKTVNMIMGIVGKYQKGILTYDQALVFIKAFGLTDDEASYFLLTPEEENLLPPTPAPAPTTTQPVANASQRFEFKYTPELEDTIIHMFDSCGDMKSDFHILTSKTKQKFDSHTSAESEISFFQGLYASKDVTNVESSIVNLIKKDKFITPEVIATTIGSTTEYVTSKIASLTKRGVLSSNQVEVGDDTQIEREVANEDLISDSKPDTVNIQIKYSYEVKPGVGAEIIPTSREFCKKLIKLNRLYSRAEIETISQKLGYSVWDRRGGWWGDNPTCRHRWVSHVVVKKGKK